MSRFVRRCSLPFLAAGLVLSLSDRATAQTFRGGINGSVTDVTGAVVSGATVTATNTGTGVKTASVSSSGGVFLFEDLPLGDYTVSINASGFANTKIDHVNVSAGQLYTLPVKLSVATAGEVVEVSAASLSLDTTSTTQTEVLDAKQVADIPLNGRDFTQMVSLTAGYAGYSGAGFGSLNGTRANQMNWQIDGVDNNDLWHNVPAVNQGGVSGIAGVILPIDAVDEFSAQTQAGPEGGRNPGGTINLSLKSGTNQLHGTAYYFNRNELFGAKSPFSDTKQKVRNYNTGFSVGGPFLKDRLFGFVTFEHQRFVIGQSGNATEPSVGWQNQALTLLNTNGIATSPLMQNVLNTLWGHANLGGDTAGLQNNYHSNDPESGYSWNGLGKVDWHLTNKDNLSVHWFVGQGNQIAPLTHYNLLPYYQVAPIHVQNIAIVYNRQISAHISNQILAGVNYFNQVFNDNQTNFDVQSLGFITGASFPNSPNIRIGNFDRVGPTPPEGRNDITGHLTDQLSWVKGSHQMRFGGEFRQAQLDEFYHRHATGAFTFDGTRVAKIINDRLPGCNVTPQTATNCYKPDAYVAPLADFLAGYTSAASIQIGDPERQVFVNTFFVNAGDNWQVNQKFNINYGVRFDYTGPLHNGTQDLSVFRPALTQTDGLALQGVQIPNLFQQYWHSFSPRVGMNYQLSNKTVLRAGYGWYFDSPNLNPFLDNRPGNSAPNGVESNPIGPNPVSGIIAPGVAGLPSGKTNIVAGRNIFSGTTTVCNGETGSVQCGIFSVDPNFRPSYNQNYSFNIEQTLAPSVILQLGYVGSEGRHLLSLLDINQGTTQQTRPYFSVYPNYTNINQIESIGTSNYNALQGTLRLQNFHRLSAQVAYTWSHNLDEVTAYRGALPQDSYNFKGDYSNSDFDTRNSVVTFLTYQVPGSAGRLRGLTNGWIANSLLSFHGGQPFSVYASGDVSQTGEGFDRAVQVGNPTPGFQGQKPGVNWLNPAAFVDAPLGSFGTTRRNAYYGPGYSDVDLSVFKDTKFGERLTVQLRAEMFNLFNRVNYAPPGGGAVSVGGDFTLNDTIGDYNGAPGIGAGEPFNTQFGAKIIF